MRLVIVESPFGVSKDAGALVPGISASDAIRDALERNIAYARAAVADCLARGESPIASHLLLTQPGILDDGLTEEREKGIEAGLAWYAVADACVVYGDLGVSSGMERGIARAKKLRVPVEARKLGDLDLQARRASFGGPGQIEDGGAKTLQEVLTLGAAGEARRIAEELILEGTRRECLGDRRGGRALAQAGDDLLREIG